MELQVFPRIRGGSIQYNIGFQRTIDKMCIFGHLSRESSGIFKMQFSSLSLALSLSLFQYPIMPSCFFTKIYILPSSIVPLFLRCCQLRGGRRSIAGMRRDNHPNRMIFLIFFFCVCIAQVNNISLSLSISLSLPRHYG